MSEVPLVGRRAIGLLSSSDLSLVDGHLLYCNETESFGSPDCRHA